MSMIPPAVLDYRKEVCEGAKTHEGVVIDSDRIERVLSEAGWTIEELDLDIKEHCLARRGASADGTHHFYEFLEPVDMPPVG